MSVVTDYIKELTRLALVAQSWWNRWALGWSGFVSGAPAFHRSPKLQERPREALQGPANASQSFALSSVWRRSRWTRDWQTCRVASAWHRPPYTTLCKPMLFQDLLWHHERTTHAFVAQSYAQFVQCKAMLYVGQIDTHCLSSASACNMCARQPQFCQCSSELRAFMQERKEAHMWTPHIGHCIEVHTHSWGPELMMMIQYVHDSNAHPFSYKVSLEMVCALQWSAKPKLCLQKDQRGQR